MNVWFVLATLCAIGIPIFSYIGTQQQSDTDSKRLQEQFSELGEQITDLKDSNIPNESNLVEIEEKYAKLAEEFYDSRHQKAARIIADKTVNTASQFEKTQESNQRFESLYQMTLKLVAAYNQHPDLKKIEVAKSEFSENLFIENATKKVYIALLTDTERWAVRPTIYDNEIVYEFGRLKPHITEYKDIATIISPFDVHFVVAKQSSGNCILANLSGGTEQEYTYISENLPKTKLINIVAEDIVQKIVELMLLPSIED